MTNNLILKSNIELAINGYDEPMTEKIILAVLLYNHISKIGVTSNVYSDVISQYATMFLEQTYNIRDNYVSYDEIKNLVISRNINGLMQMGQEEYNKILSLCKDTLKVEKFDLNHYSPMMYRLGMISDRDNTFLKKVHNLILVPICRYYVLNKEAKAEDLVIVSATMSNFGAGHDVSFTIKGISPDRIIRDIRSNRIYLEKYLLNSIMLYNNNVRIKVKGNI
jgi:hypothetical protein